MARYQWTKDDANALVQQARSLGLDPASLGALIELESGGDPNIWGGAGGQYRGLIQFGPSARKEVGLPGGAMTAAQQMPYVGKYFQQRGFRPGEHGVTEMYRTVLVGNPHQSGTDSFGTNSDKAAKRMKPGGDLYERARTRLSTALGGALPSITPGAGGATSITAPAAQLAAGSLRDSFLQDPGAMAVVEKSAPKAFDIGSIAAGGLTGGSSSGGTDRLAGAVAAAVLGGTAARKPIDTSDLTDDPISDPATGLPQNTLPSVGAAAGASQARSPGAGGGAWTSRKRDPDAEATGWDVVLSGGRGAAIPAPVPIRITGTGFQGQGAGEGGRGYGNWVSGMFEKNGKQYELLLGHLDRVDVRPGMTLPMGAPIGTQGITGRTFGTHITTHVNPKSGASVDDAWNALDYVTRQWEGRGA